MNVAVWTVLVPLFVRVAGNPKPEDVKAGWLGFTVFLLLAAAVAFLGFSLRKHLRKVDFEEQDAEPAGTTNGDPSNGGARNGA